MKSIKVIAILCIFIMCSALSGCGRSFSFPKDTDFSLVASVSKETLKVGEDLEVKAVFENLTKSDYLLEYGIPFGDSSIIVISTFNVDGKDEMLLYDDILRTYQLKAQEKVVNNKELQMNHAGKYKVLVNVNFDIKNPKTNEKKTYNLKVDPFLVEVK